MRSLRFLLAVTSFGLLSFSTSSKEFEFTYPKDKTAKVSLSSGHFKKFSAEWRGSDYYYMAEKDGFICSVLFYKLNEEERLGLIEAPRAAMKSQLEEAGKTLPGDSPIFAYAYFKNYSNLKSMEKNDSSWGEPTDDFMYRKNEVQIQGTNISQTHMYGYGMFGKDLFVNVHLSRMSPSESESEEMLALLKSLRKVR